MFDHLGIYTAGDLRAQAEFYEAILEPLGCRQLQTHIDPGGGGRVVFGSGVEHAPFFVLAKGKPAHWRAEQQNGLSAIHLAFRAPSQAAVDQFHAIGVLRGARDNGEPGPRQRGWYGAYLIDEDNNGIEAGLYLPR